MRDYKKQTAQEWMDELIALHDQIKSHPFRQEFTNQTNIGTWRSLFREYSHLIYETTEVMCSLEYYCTDDSPLEKGDDFWIHDFRSWLMNIHSVYIETRYPPNLDKNINGLNMTYGELLGKTHITDVGAVMIFLDQYVGYIHQFIETGVFVRTAGVHYELSANPHNGYYYKHMTEYEKRDGKWGFVNPPQLIGTKQTN
jgi:hypothetical protein